MSNFIIEAIDPATAATLAAGGGLPDFDVEATADIILTTFSVAVPVAALFTGVVVMQWSKYIWGTRKEPTLLKTFATVVMIANLVRLGSEIESLRGQNVEGRKAPMKLLIPSYLSAIDTAATTISILTVQYYFSNIIFKMTRSNRILAFISAFLMLATTVGGIGSVWAFINISRNGLAKPPHLFSGLGLALYCLWLGSSAIFDVLVSSILCFKFFSTRKGEFGVTNDILTYLLVSTLETFSLTATTALVATLLAVLPYSVSGLNILRCNMGNAVTTSLLCRINAICFLYSLHRRAPLRARLQESSASNAGQTGPRNTFNKRNTLIGSRVPADGVQIHTDLAMRTDQVGKGGYREDLGEHQMHTFSFQPQRDPTMVYGRDEKNEQPFIEIRRQDGFV